MNELMAPAPIPKVAKEKTALFTAATDTSNIRPANIKTYAQKVRDEARKLILQGYDTFIVSFGSNYGITALRTLLELKTELDHTFTIIAVKVLMEQQTLFADQFRDLTCNANECDHCLDLMRGTDFLKTVYPLASKISTEEGLYKPEDFPFNGFYRYLIQLSDIPAD